LLNNKRKKKLQQIHLQEKQLERIDYLKFKMKELKEK